MKSRKVYLRFPNLGDIGRTEIVCYATHAIHASLECGASQRAHIVLLEGNENVIPLSWQLKLSRVTKSPLALETLSLSDGADTSFLMDSLTQDIFQLEEMPKITCVTGKSLLDTVHMTNVTKDLRVRVEIAALCQVIHEDEINVFWVDGGRQITDRMTKKGASPNKLLEVLRTSSLSSLQ